MISGTKMTWRNDILEEKTLCTSCGHLQDESFQKCHQCGATVHQRIPYSLMLTWGYAIAASIFLIPANLLPMMVVTALGSDEGSTIMEGVVYFVKHGEMAIGAIIFIASVAVPIFKLGVLFYLLLIAHFKIHDRALQGTKLYHLIHFIGKWSMLDIFVVALMVSIVQFQSLASIHTGGAAIAFASAVVLTIMATEKFDTRLMWDEVINKQEDIQCVRKL